MSLPAKTWTCRVAGLVATGLLAASCTQIGDTLIAEGMSAAAKDQIMLVRKEPPSFGYQRLTMQSNDLPDLKSFLARQGLPDFLAETSNRERRYFIFYYLDQRHAFVCRHRLGNRRAVEFAGPYPITAGEFRLLDDFRRDPGHKPVNR
jgi:hypothetical protein